MRGFELGMSQGALDESGSDAGFEQMGGGRMPEGRDGDAHGGDPGSLCGCAEGALDPGATHRGSRRRTVDVIAPGGGKEPGGCRGVVQEVRSSARVAAGKGTVPVFGAFATVDWTWRRWPSRSETWRERAAWSRRPKRETVGKETWLCKGVADVQESLDLLHTEDGGEPVGGLRAKEREGVPVTLEDMLGEEADATVADAHGRWGEAIDVLPVQASSAEAPVPEIRSGDVW